MASAKRTYESLVDPNETVEVWICDDECCRGAKLHRDDGPAVVFADGAGQCWRHGVRFPQEDTTSSLAPLLDDLPEYLRVIHGGLPHSIKAMKAITFKLKAENPRIAGEP